MSDKFVRVWVLIAVVMPSLVGVLLLTNPSSFLPAGTTPEEMARTIAFRSFAFSIVLILAFIRRHHTVVGYLLLLRGLLEISDAASSFMAGHGGNAIFPVILAGISFWVASYVLRKPEHELPTKAK